MKKKAKDLMVGEIIPPPTHERKWLKNPLTILEIKNGRIDKRGEWLLIRCSFQSPYGSNYSEMKIEVRPNTNINVLQAVA